MDHFASNFKAFLTDTKHIVLLKADKKSSLTFPTFVILDLHYST